MPAHVEEIGERDARRKAWDGREAIVLEFRRIVGLVVGGCLLGGAWWSI